MNALMTFFFFSLLKLQSNTVFCSRTVKHPAEVSEVSALQHYRPAPAQQVHAWSLHHLPGASGTCGAAASSPVRSFPRPMPR